LLNKVTKNDEENESSEPSALSFECGDCLSAVGQAIWNCGTLEVSLRVMVYLSQNKAKCV
jgi:hypothetical protein